jgi:hypothetical protein
MIVMAAGVGLNRLAFDAWSGILTVTALVALTIPVLTWLAREEGDPRPCQAVDVGHDRHDRWCLGALLLRHGRSTRILRMRENTRSPQASWPDC